MRDWSLLFPGSCRCLWRAAGQVKDRGAARPRSGAGGGLEGAGRGPDELAAGNGSRGRCQVFGCFMHEFNNPLAIVTSRIEVLLEERKEDVALCGDLQQMLKEMRYMGNIARTLLQALRRERGSEVFEPSAPSEALQEAVAALRSL